MSGKIKHAERSKYSSHNGNYFNKFAMNAYVKQEEKKKNMFAKFLAGELAKKNTEVNNAEKD